MSIEAKIQEFSAIAANPAAQLKKFKDEGKKVVGVLPYYAPEELVYAAGMVPMGIWGSNDKTIVRSKEYCATFYCTIAQLALEMLLDGTMDQLDALITPTICDTLRPMSQNFRVAVGSKIPWLIPRTASPIGALSSARTSTAACWRSWLSWLATT